MDREFDKSERRLTQRDAWELFENRYRGYRIGRAEAVREDGTETRFTTYRVPILTEQPDTAGVISQFSLLAAQAGFKSTIGPIVMPPGSEQKSLTTIYFCLQEPPGR